MMRGRIVSGAALVVAAGGFALAVAGAGCDGKTEASPIKTTAAAAFKSSCNNVKTLSSCTDYTEQAFALGENFVKSACEATGGVYSTTPCPQPRLVGRCNIDGGQTRKYYSEGMLSYDAGDAEKDCKDLYSGRWAMK
jgi:hypothetical protein